MAPHSPPPSPSQLPTRRSLRELALEGVLTADFKKKQSSAEDLTILIASLSIATTSTISDSIGSSLSLSTRLPVPGRSDRPPLVVPAQVPRRSMHTRQGRAALIHSIAHIEFNAINLALDAIWRFADMPAQYYLDWVKVAGEEAKHFGLLRDLLQSMGYDYGDFPAHDGLWEMTEKTQHDITARMALVPRTLEARGLDATPLIQAKLQAFVAQVQQRSARAKQADPYAVADCEAFLGILNVILADEIGHVAIGNHWYRWLCERNGHDPIAHYAVLAKRYQAPTLKPPFNVVARRQAGFGDVELDALHSACAGTP